MRFKNVKMFTKITLHDCTVVMYVLTAKPAPLLLFRLGRADPSPRFLLRVFSWLVGDLA